MKNKIIIVNKEDNLIGTKKRGTLSKDDIYRVSALWITDSKSKILLARRHRNKKHHPRMWGPAVAGTVDEGETYQGNIIKEAQEELGLKNISPKLGPKLETKGEYHHFTQWYFLKIDKESNEFIIQKDEVEEIKWWDKEELLTELKRYPEKFLPKMKKYLELFH